MAIRTSIDVNASIEDIKNDNILRPQDFDTYIGQNEVKENMKVYIQAAKKRGESLDHVLLYGPPGLGKTTLAGIIAAEMGVNIKVTSGPSISKPGDMAIILRSLSKGDVLFIDEIHRLTRPVEEMLYSAMEDFKIDIPPVEGQQNRKLRLPMPSFTLVGATTRAGMLSAPLRDRFGVINHLNYYSPAELMTIILNSANKLGVKMDESGALELAKRSRGTPRLANRFLKRCRDFAEVNFNGIITGEVVDTTLTRLDVDKLGLDSNDTKMLMAIIERFNGGPVGLDTLAAAIGEDSGTIEDVYEPYLVMNDFIVRTPKGRMATDKTYSHFNMTRQ